MIGSFASFPFGTAYFLNKIQCFWLKNPRQIGIIGLFYAQEI